MSQQTTRRSDTDPYRSEHFAGFGRRLVAALADMVVLSVLTIPLGAFALGLRLLLQLLAHAAYFVILEGGRSGQTLGKRVAGIRVADARNGGPIGSGRALVRHVGRYVSGLALGLGYLSMLWDPREQTWHDKMANAVVVRAPGAPVPPSS
jgi:uncharacterized RDD family membrane protein YckC